MISRRSIRRLATATAIGAAAAVGMVGATTASAVEAPQVQSPAGTVTCFVTTVGVPVYNVPPGVPGSTIVAWVGQGQGFNVYGNSAYWRLGNLWGGQSGVYIHSNYLRAGTSNPNGPACTTS